MTTEDREQITGDPVNRVSELRDALQYILDARNTEGDCYEFVARLKGRAYDALQDVVVAR